MSYPLSFFILLFFTLFSTHGVISEQLHIMLPTDPPLREKLTHLHFYYHDIRTGKNPSIFQIIDTPQHMPNGFGSIFVMDNVMTEGPELSSKHIGRAQGLFGFASYEDLGMFMSINFAFKEGEYAGSTLSMLGRNPVSEQFRETAIVGGTGVFRFARGYAILNSVDSISTLEHYVVEYNINVYHPTLEGIWDGVQ